jgi:hypothetical protein
MGGAVPLRSLGLHGVLAHSFVFSRCSAFLSFLTFITTFSFFKNSRVKAGYHLRTHRQRYYIASVKCFESDLSETQF